MNASMNSNRRKFLRSTSAVAGAASLSWLADARAEASLTDLTALQALTAMRNGEIKAEAYASALLDRHDALRALNAFIALDRDKLLEAARRADTRRMSGVSLGALHGLPVAVKDSINTKGLPTTSGTRALRNFQPKEDAPVLKALFSADAILMGKTNLDEVSYGWASNNAFTGSVHNPYDQSRIPGGSSGGSGAVVAARIAPLALGTDSFGSIRIPATMCGVCGLRPSFGRYPNAAVMGISPDFFDTPGLLARSIADLALFDSVITSDYTPLRARPLQGARIGVAAEYFLRELDPEVERIMSQTLKRLQAAGAVLIWAELPEPVKDAMLNGYVIQNTNTMPTMSKYLADYGTGVSFDQLVEALSPGVRWVFDNYSLPNAPNYPSSEKIAAAITLMHVIRKAMTAYFRNQQIDAIAFPPVFMPPPPIGQDAEIEVNGQKLPIWYVMGHNISVGSCASLPGLVLPAGLTRSGLPVGIEFDGPSGSDRQLLALGLSLEKALGPIAPPRLGV